MATTGVPLEKLFPVDGDFNLRELLKIVQRSGISPLWAEVNDPFQHILDRETKPKWGQEARHAYTVDPGGGSVARLAQQNGRFAPGDRTRNILASVNPKYQTITYQFQRFHDMLSKDEQVAYINSQKQEFTEKNKFQKSFMILQMHMDGTGRHAKPLGLGEDDEAAAASFTLAGVKSPMRIKVSGLSEHAGSVAYCMEGLVVSFAYIDIDANNDGTNDTVPTNAGAFPRLLALSFTDTTLGATKTYDAFRIVEVLQEEDAIYVQPAREYTATLRTYGDYVQHDEWVPGGGGAVTVAPIKGLRADLPSTDAGHGVALTNFAQFFAAGAAGTWAYLIHPLYINQTQADAKTQLGLGWTSSTELDKISDGILTGLEALLTDREHVIHGIDRNTVRQYLPTYKRGHSNEMSYNMLYAALSQHVNRNRGTLPKWSVIGMNPIVYSSMISQSENDRRISEGTGVRGEEGAKYIKIFDKKFQLEASSVQKKPLVYCIADKHIVLKDGDLRRISVDGQSSFLAIQGGQRVNVEEAYGEVVGELCIEKARNNLFIDNFKYSTF